MYPCGPVAPVEPTPGIPVAPIGPVAPDAPAKPAGPVAPVGPVAPINPIGDPIQTPLEFMTAVVPTVSPFFIENVLLLAKVHCPLKICHTTNV